MLHDPLRDGLGHHRDFRRDVRQGHTIPPHHRGRELAYSLAKLVRAVAKLVIVALDVAQRAWLWRIPFVTVPALSTLEPRATVSVPTSTHRIGALYAVVAFFDSVLGRCTSVQRSTSQPRLRLHGGYQVLSVTTWTNNNETLEISMAWSVSACLCVCLSVCLSLCLSEVSEACIMTMSCSCDEETAN